MDPEAAARRLLEAVAAGTPIVDFLAPQVHFRSDTADVLDRDAVVAHIAARLEGKFTSFKPGQIAMKRNLIFAWWQIEGLDGVQAQGTWILSFDRDGHVVEWQEFKG